MKDRVKDAQKRLLTLLIALVLGCFTILKPVHIDEANFLMLTKGEFFAPHNVLVNWQGKTERAFDVLSNPAGIAWFLWPFRHLDPMWMRLMMLSWIVLLWWGVQKFARFYRIEGEFLFLFTLFSPCIFLSIGSIMPDIPLLALYISGLAGVICKRSYLWAFVAGMATLFRYSGLTVIPLIFVWVLFQGMDRRGIALILISCVPFSLLTVFDFIVYQESHFLHMMNFQATDSSPFFPKFSSLLAMLSAAVILPSVPKVKQDYISLAIGIGFSIGMYSIVESVWSTVWIALGVYIICRNIQLKQKENNFLLIWMLGGIVFLSFLRFAASRYWIPFFFPIILLGIPKKKFREKMILLCSTTILSIFLALDDYRFATAHKEAAMWVQQHQPTGMFAGHWGWQHYLEESKWKIVEETQGNKKRIIRMRLALRGLFKITSVTSESDTVVPPRGTHRSSCAQSSLGWIICTIDIEKTCLQRNDGA